eukprot:gene21102-23163_t
MPLQQQQQQQYFRPGNWREIRQDYDFIIMAPANEWKDDDDLRLDLVAYSRQGTNCQDILDYVLRDFPQYTWSFRTLCCRLAHFNINKLHHAVSVVDVKDAMQKELNGPGRDLGYRAMHQKVRQVHKLNVLRDLVYAIMTELDSQGLRGRAVGARKQKKGCFVSKGPDWVQSLDGHCKLMGYQRCTFPLAVYGCLDTASRKLFWIRVWTTDLKQKTGLSFYC